MPEWSEGARALFQQGLKQCTNCKEIKPISAFAEDIRHGDGLQSRCRECSNLLRRTKYGDKVRATARAYYRENKEEILPRKCEYNRQNWPHFKDVRHRHWEEDPTIREHYLTVKRSWHQRNKSKENTEARTRMKAWRLANPEKFRANQRRREMRKRSLPGDYTEEQWQTLLELCGHKCVKCGSPEDLRRDHIIPLSWPDCTGWIANMQPLCHTCNSVKQDHEAVDYRPEPVAMWAWQETLREVNSKKEQGQ